MSTPGPEFASCFLKLGRLKQHFETFKAEFTEWSRSDPYTILKNSNDDGSQYTVSLVVNKPPPVDRWALIAGDCIHNLRSALDNMVYALAVRDSGKNPPPNFRSLQYPVVIRASDFQNKIGMIAPLNTTSRAFIERCQPSNRSQQPIPMPLFVLSELDNIDKHRLLNVALQHLGEVNFAWKTTLHGEPKFNTISTPIQGDTDIVYVTLDPPQTNVEFDVEASFVITLSYPTPIGKNGITILQKLLEVLIGEVESIINAIP